MARDRQPTQASRRAWSEDKEKVGTKGVGKVAGMAVGCLAASLLVDCSSSNLLQRWSTEYSIRD
jgi:hypothetical protein